MDDNDRFWCPLSPCVVKNDDGSIAIQRVAGGVSFATIEAYNRHLGLGHFYTPGTPGTEPIIEKVTSRGR
jgi:hypothetical protein